MATEFNPEQSLVPKDVDEWQDYLAGAVPVASPEDQSPEVRVRSYSNNLELGAYLREIGEIPLLTKEEERKLAQQIETGKNAENELATGRLPKVRRIELRNLIKQGEAAKKHFAEANLRLVVSIARRYQGRGLDLLDLIQEGSVGLQRGVELFNWRRDLRFSTYGYRWIQQAITRAVKDQGRDVRIPTHLYDTYSEISRIRMELIQKLNREPKIEELAAETNIEIYRLREILEAFQYRIRLDTPIGDGDGFTYGDFIPAKENTEDEVLEAEAENILDEVLSELSKREKEIITYRYGLNGVKKKTLGELAEEMDLTSERIRQIEAAALRKLRENTKMRKIFFADDRVAFVPARSEPALSFSKDSLWRYTNQNSKTRPVPTPLRRESPTPEPQKYNPRGFENFFGQFELDDD